MTQIPSHDPNLSLLCLRINNQSWIGIVMHRVESSPRAVGLQGMGLQAVGKQQWQLTAQLARGSKRQGWMVGLAGAA